GDGTFGFTATGPGFSQTPTITTSGGNGITTPTYTVSPGSGFSVTETTIPAGWSTTPSISCVDQANASVTNTSFAVAAGGIVTCTFTNTKLAAIILVKKTTGGNGSFAFTDTGGLTPSSFNIQTNNNTGSQSFLVAPGTSGYSFS